MFKFTVEDKNLFFNFHYENLIKYALYTIVILKFLWTLISPNEKLMACARNEHFFFITIQGL